MLYSVELGSQHIVKDRILFVFLVGVPGFEPGTPCSQSRCANRTALHPEENLLYEEDFVLRSRSSHLAGAKIASFLIQSKFKSNFFIKTAIFA